MKKTAANSKEALTQYDSKIHTLHQEIASNASTA